LHAAGRLTAGERAAVARDAIEQVIAPCARALLAAAQLRGDAHPTVHASTRSVPDVSAAIS
jgi:hypothetical protein